MVKAKRTHRLLRAGPGGAALRSAAVVTKDDPRQPSLLSNPMPERIEPCLALLVGKPPVGPEWLFEVKWDGYRLAVHIEAEKVHIITRGGHDWTHRFPTIAAAAAGLELQSAILDGEAVVLDERGSASFQALQQALGGRGGKRHAKEAILYAFDLLYLDGYDLRELPLDDRRAMLSHILDDAPAGLRLSEELDVPGAALLERACALGLEGIIAKLRSSHYRPGRGGEWQKIKCVLSETFLIIGYEPSTVALSGIGRLLMAARKDDGLAYVGGVGTGFSYKAGTALRRQLDKLRTPKPPFPLKYKGAHWISPELPAEIEFRGWTDDGKLRHASFKGLREEAEMGEIYEL